MNEFALEIKDLKKVYNDGFVALKGINLKVKNGDFFALLGANGAGKSTTLGIVSSLVNITSGEVSVFGKNLNKHRDEVKRKIGVVPQEFNFSTFEKVHDIIMQQAGYYGLPKAVAAANTEKYLKKLELWDKRDKQARFLSGGMKRRLMIARALVHEPELLILDEPTAGVDIEIRRTMWELLSELNEQGKTIILTTHYLEEAENLCKNIAIIKQGEIIVDTSMRELLSRLDKSTFVFDLEQNVKELDLLDNMTLTQGNQLEVEIKKGHSLNEVMQFFLTHNIQVQSVRPKTNRLEELFVSLSQTKGEKK
ncbi:MAG: ABC transporter ATP-binding protein [Saccharospirillaceae bacterium]|nr:ABC transporter ATP-binding protein [Pseudomonadales bacterium]NRB80022.1 ABC transporter ATP-binding protein [Saccharospirillaceae bacterium]